MARDAISGDPNLGFGRPDPDCYVQPFRTQAGPLKNPNVLETSVIGRVLISAIWGPQASGLGLTKIDQNRGQMG